MRVLADFVVESDLCIPEQAAPLVIRSDLANAEATLTNIGAGSPEEAAELACRLVFDAPRFDEAQQVANETVVRTINCLAYATNRKFAVRHLLKLVEWDPGLKERQAVIFHHSPMDDRAQPELGAEFARTTERLMAMQSDPRQANAMRWYRLGIQSLNIEEQFSYFWFALEIAAQTLKRPEKVNSKCPQCHQKLYCETCQKHPTHRPFPADAIRQVVERVHPHNCAEVFETLQKMRHTLMHGERLEAVADELPCTEEQAVNKLAYGKRLLKAVWRGG
jgi:hypothetical protein